MHFSSQKGTLAHVDLVGALKSFKKEDCSVQFSSQEGSEVLIFQQLGHGEVWPRFKEMKG